MKNIKKLNLLPPEIKTKYANKYMLSIAGVIGALVLCQDNGHIKPLLFGKISKMHKVVAFIPRFA